MLLSPPLFALLFVGALFASEFSLSSAESDVLLKIEQKLAKKTGGTETGNNILMDHCVGWLRFEKSKIRGLFKRDTLLIEHLKTLTAIETAPEEEKCSANTPSIKAQELMAEVSYEQAPLLHKMVSFYTRKIALDCRQFFIEKFTKFYSQMGAHKAQVATNTEKFIKFHLEQALKTPEGSRLRKNKQLSLYNAFVLEFQPLDPMLKEKLIPDIIDPNHSGFKNDYLEYQALTDVLVGPCMFYIQDLGDIFIPAMHDALLLAVAEDARVDGDKTNDYYLAWARYAVCQDLIEDYLEIPKPTKPVEDGASSSRNEIEPEKADEVVVEIV